MKGIRAVCTNARVRRQRSASVAPRKTREAEEWRSGKTEKGPGVEARAKARADSCWTFEIKFTFS